MANGREPSLGELSEDLEGLKVELGQVRREVKSQGDEILRRIDGLPFLRTDVYEANHRALRSEVELKMEAIRSEQGAVARTAEGARALSQWALGLILVAVIGAIVVAVSQGIGQ